MNEQAMTRLWRQVGGFVLLALFLLLGGLMFAHRVWAGNAPWVWVVGAALASGYFLFGLWRGLPQNRRAGSLDLLPTLGWGNGLTMVRSLMLAMLFGFLFVPRPEGWANWLPGLLYLLAALPDYLDGYLARITNHVTELGGDLDMRADSVGVFTATTLAVLYGILPWWYWPIGLARYLFLFGIFIRERRGLRIYEMPDSVRRRGFAALKMGFMFVVLFPPFRPPGTYVAAVVFGIPFALGFLLDWGYVAGLVTPEQVRKLDGWKQAIIDWVPVGLRIAAIALLVPVVTDYFSRGGAWVGLGWLGVVATFFLVLGVAGHTSAMLAVIVIGYAQMLAPLSPAELVLIAVYIGMIFLGSGRFSLWPIEDRLIYHRIGDSPAA